MPIFNRDPDGPPDNAPPSSPPTPAPGGAPFPLTVRVHSATTGAPIAGALITADESALGGALHTTGADGAVTFQAIARIYRFEISAIGYEQLVFSVNVLGESTIAPVLVGGGLIPDTPTPSSPPGRVFTPAPGPGAPAPLGPSVIEIRAAPPAPVVELAPVQYVTIDGVPHITAASMDIGDIDGGGSPWLFAIVAAVDFIASLFGGGGGESTDTKQDREIKQLQAALLRLGLNVVNGAYSSLERDGRVLGTSHGILTKILGPLINAIATLFGKVHDTLLAKLGPLIKFLNKVRKQIQHFYDVWLRPILATIDAFRKFLQLLELFHVKWAATLDAQLQKLERKLTDPILKLLAWVNEASNLLDRILTLDGALQRVALLKGAIANADELMNLWWTKLHHPLTASKAAVYATPIAGHTVDGAVETVRSYVVDGAGDDRARIDEASQDLEIRLARVAA